MRSIRITKLEYYLDFWFMPLFIIVPIAMGPNISSVDLLSQWYGGYFAWTLFEYTAHRWIFHGRYRRAHWVHHITPLAYVGASSYYTLPAFTLLMALSMLSAVQLSAMFSGFAFGYLLYILIHDAIHHESSVFHRLVGHRRRIHQLHHRTGRDINFGVSTSLWDLLFGTYVRPQA